MEEYHSSSNTLTVRGRRVQAESETWINLSFSTTLHFVRISKHQVKPGFKHVFELNFPIYRDYQIVNLTFAFETRWNVGSTGQIATGKIVGYDIHSIFD